MVEEVYLDYAAATPVADSVYKRMELFFKEKYGNPSALHKLGVEAQEAISDSRKKISNQLKVQPDTCFFTGSATEANNLAILGAAERYKQHGKHIITTKVEHPSVLEPINKLKTKGFEVTYLEIDENGWFSIEKLKKSLREDTILISLMYVNNEIGNIYPIQEVGREIIKFRKEQDSRLPLFHTDACQATNYLHLDVRKLHTDLLVLNGSKIYASKGTGLLYKNREVELEPILYGGGQERGLRSGTENVPGIVGLASAVKRAQENKQQEKKRVFKLQKYFFKELKQKFSDQIALNGPQLKLEERIPNNLNILFKGIENEKLLLYLSSENIYCSSGSACSFNKKSKLSNVVNVIGSESKQSIRFTMGKYTDRDKINYTIEKLSKILTKIK